MVYSGDTEPCPRVAALANGADLLIHECSFPEPFDVTNHTTPKKLGSMIKNQGSSAWCSRTSTRRHRDARMRWPSR